MAVNERKLVIHFLCIYDLLSFFLVFFTFSSLHALSEIFHIRLKNSKIIFI